MSRASSTAKPGANPAALHASVVRPVSLVLAASLLLLLAGTAWLPLLDRDEPRFARATVEMMQRGDWVVPWFNGAYRFDKPALTYWLMAAGYAVFGVGELGARVHSVLAAVLVAVGIFWLGRRLFTAAVGFGAAFAWATCLQVFIHGRLALADMPMVLAVLVVHAALWERLFGESDGYDRWFWALWLGLAAGFLAKGPIAVAVPALTLLLLRLFRGRQGLPWRRLRFGLGLPVAIAVVGAWGIPALVRTGGQFWDVGIGEHVVRRGLVAFNRRPIVPFYYLATVWFSLFPWSPMLGQAIVTVRRGWREDTTRFLVAWLVGPYLVFSVYSTQLPHYTMPAFPALLLLMFRGGLQTSSWPRASRRLYLGVHALFAALLLAAIAFVSARTLPAAAVGLKTPLLALLAAALTLQATALSLRHGFPNRSTPGPDGSERLMPRPDRNSAATTAPTALRPATYAGLLATAALTMTFALTVRPLAVSIRVQELLSELPADTMFVARGYTEPSLVFYSNAHWNLAGKGPSPSMLRTGKPVAFVYRLGETGLDRLFRAGDQSTADATLSLERRARRAGVPRWLVDSDLRRVRVQGFNFARSTWTDLLVLYRK